MGVALQSLLDLQGQPVHPTPHIGVPVEIHTGTREGTGIIGAAR
jgi:hypothetical protein